ncbi:MAG: hypothetical protein ACE5G0_10065 [Rhodothermales bacterium]
MTDALTLQKLTRTLRERGIHLRVHKERLKVKGSREALSPTLVQAIRANSAALLRETMCDEYAPLLLELWGRDVIGPLACWIWFEVEQLPMDIWITTSLYADRALYRRVKEGIETGPSFRNKAHLRGALMALYEYVELSR